MTKEDQKDFKNLIPHPAILASIEESGFTVPTPIQEQAIPHILKGLDLMGSAQTGTGKTAAFLLPILALMLTPSTKPGKGPRVLILVPTRELAMQVAAEAKKYATHISPFKVVCIYGGTSYHTQIKDLSRPHEILVATPGRLIDHMQQHRVKYARLEVFILDEADRMLDMGFIKPVEEIAAALPSPRQTLLFSATLKGTVLTLAKRLLKNPVEVSVAAQHEKHENIEQKMVNVQSTEQKYQLLNEVLNDPAMQQTIVFTSTKRQAEQLSDKLEREGQKVAVLHGDMKQNQRTRTVFQLRQGALKVLVATDVAARGIDIPTISHVVNFDLPMNAEDYVHRIGRTGRAGSKGTALSFVRQKDWQMAREIEKFTGQKLLTSAPQHQEKPAQKPFQKKKGGFWKKHPSKGGRSQRPKFGR